MSKTPGQEWYSKYLNGSHWRRTRAEALERCGHKCDRCGMRDGEMFDVPALSGLGMRTRLEVHHLNYERVGAELDTDLRVLCQLCHRETHATITDFQRHAMNCADRHRRMNTEAQIMRDVLGDDDGGIDSTPMCLSDAIIDMLEDYA